MKRSAIVLATVVALASQTARADCEGSLTVKDVKLPPEKLALRKGAYGELCRKRGGLLVDSEDQSLAGRLTMPGEEKVPPPGSYGTPPLDRTVAKLEPVILVYIIEIDGSVSWLSILHSSGNTQLDNVGAAFYLGMKYPTPAILDGKPVPIFMTSKIKLVRREFESNTPLPSIP
jgi:hypothetical protein